MVEGGLMPTIKEFLLEELHREVRRSRKAL